MPVNCMDGLLIELKEKPEESCNMTIYCKGRKNPIKTGITVKICNYFENSV